MRWIEVPSGCWVSTNRSKATGYGYTTSYKGRKGSQYRILWEIVTGEQVPKGMQLDHLCNNGPGGCVNPDHVQVTTPRENTLRSSNPLAQKARQSHCKKGHAFTPENTRVVQRKNGHASRFCMICEKERNDRWRAENPSRARELQKRYEQSEKGKASRRARQQRYREQRRAS